MSLQAQLKDDMRAAMKSRDTETLAVLRVAVGDITRIKDKNGKPVINPTNEQIIIMLKSMSENAKLMGADGEVMILEGYLPQMMTEDQLRLVIEEVIEENGYSGMQDMGKVMKELRSPIIDGKIASDITKELLNQ
jgi:uncharacterized protein YqeY